MYVVEALSSDELQRRWKSLTEDPELEDCDDRIELDAYGELSMTPPPSQPHQRISTALGRQIEAFLGGEAIVACPVVVDGVFIADCAWFGGNRAMTMDTPAAEQPELVVEVMSPSNTRKGIRAKAARYLRHGVEEVIIVEMDGTLRYITAAGESATSRFGLQLSLPPNTYPIR